MDAQGQKGRRSLVRNKQVGWWVFKIEHFLWMLSLKFAFSPEKRENTVNASIRFSNDNKSLRKKVESSAKAVWKKAWLKIVIPLMSALFLINSKRTSKASINRYGEMGSPWRARFSKLKYGVVKSLSLLKKRFWHSYFPVNFVKFLRTLFFKNTSGGCFWRMIVYYLIIRLSSVWKLNRNT